MGFDQRVYRSVVRLYPKDLRTGYGDDMVQHFTDLMDSCGRRRAWQRTTIDLAVTLPRYRIETIVTTRFSTPVLNLIVIGLAVAGVMGYLTGLYPGALLLVAAATVAITQRGQLARSIRTPGRRIRRRRLLVAASLAVTGFASTIAMVADVRNDPSWHGGKLLLYNAIFFGTFIGSAAYLIIGLLTPGAGTRPNSDHWQKLLGGGALAIAATLTAVNITGDLSQNWWLATMLTFVAALITTLTGAILGIAHIAGHRRGHAALPSGEVS